MLFSGFIDLLMIFFVVCGPIKALAVFNVETAAMPKAERVKIALKAVIVTSAIMFAFAFRGSHIIDLFHVSVPALEIAGGIILFVFALNIVLGESHDNDPNAGKKGSSIAVYPLAMPLMASPQGIVAVVVVMSRTHEFADKMVVWSALGFQMLINLAILVGFAMLKPGSDGAQKSNAVGEVFLRIVALLFCAFAVELVLSGLRDLNIVPAIAGAHGLTDMGTE